MSDTKRTCIACGQELEFGRQRCPSCRSFQSLKLCEICKKAMPRGASHCRDCKSYQGRQKYFQYLVMIVGFLGTIFGVIAAGWSGVIYILDRDSHTEFKVSGSDDRRIFLGVANSGRQSSTLTDFRLIVNEQTGKEITLELRDADQPLGKNVIAGGGSITVGLSRVLNETLPVWRRGRQLTSKEQQRFFANPHWVDLTFTLEVDVVESDDPCTLCNRPRSHHTRTQRFPAGRIQTFVRKALGGQILGGQI